MTREEHALFQAIRESPSEDAPRLVVLDGTIVNIALPSAQQTLGFSNGDRPASASLATPGTVLASAGTKSLRAGISSTSSSLSPAACSSSIPATPTSGL